MLVTFLVILFSDLAFTDVTIQGLLQWYNHHPFAFIIAIQDIILGSLILFRLFSLCFSVEEDTEVENLENLKNDATWVVYSNNDKK